MLPMWVGTGLSTIELAIAKGDFAQRRRADDLPRSARGQYSILVTGRAGAQGARPAGWVRPGRRKVLEEALAEAEALGCGASCGASWPT
jgi:hypothetical protein